MEGEWQHSTEGDLDPDLTEEAGYSGWEPPERAWLPIVLRLLAFLIALSLGLGALLTLR